jgi:hypothetical protein
MMPTRWNGNPSTLRSFLPSLKDVLEKPPKVNLIVSGTQEGRFVTVNLVETFPASNLVSFSDIEAPLRTESSSGWQKLLASSRRLKTLGFAYIPSFDPTGERLPPIENLILLRGMYWNYSAKDVERVWDFSLLQDL